MPYWNVRRRGFTFVFKSDSLDDEMAHIYARHLKTEEDAMRVFFTGTETRWDEGMERFETFTDTEGLQWFWIDEAARILMVTSCFDTQKA